MRNVQTDTDQRKEKKQSSCKTIDQRPYPYHRDKCQTVNHFLKIFLRAREKED